MEVTGPEFMNLGSGFDGATPSGGNSPADSVFDQVLPNAVVARSSELFALARKSSLWTLSFGLACCAIEMMSAHMSHHDLDRFGVVTWPSPRQADVMIVAGTVVKKMADPIVRLYEQMPDPKWDILKEYFKENDVDFWEIHSVDGDVLSKIINLIYLLDFSTIYKAVIDGVDPQPVKSIDYVKKLL